MNSIDKPYAGGALPLTVRSLLVLCVLFVHPLLKGCWDIWAQTLVQMVCAFLLFGEVLKPAGMRSFFKKTSSSLPSHPTLASLLVLAWGIWSIMSFSLSPFPNSALQGHLVFINAGVLFFILRGRTSSDPSFRDRYIDVFLFSCLTISLWRISAYIFDVERSSLFEFVRREFVSVDHVFVNANLAAALHIFAFPAFLEKAFPSANETLNSKQRIFWILLLVPFLLSLVLAKSVFANAIVLAYCVVFLWSKLKLSLRAVFWGMLIAALASMILLPWAVHHHWAEISQVQRVQWAQSAWNMFLSHPWLGVGPGGFAEAYAGYRVGPLTTSNTLYAHNFVLEMMAEMGLGGFLIFAGIVFSVVFAGFRANMNRRLDPLIWGVILFLGFNILNFGLSLPSLLWIMFCHLAVCLPVEPPRERGVGPLWAVTGLVFAAYMAIFSVRAFQNSRLTAQAQVALGNGEWEKSVFLSKKAIKIFRHGTQPRAILSADLARNGHLTEAVMEITKAIQSSPCNARLYAERAAYWKGLKKEAEALADLKLACRFNPLDSYFWWEAAELQLKSGDRDGAIQGYRNIVTLYRQLYYRMYTSVENRKRRVSLLKAAEERLKQLSDTPVSEISASGVQ